MIFHRGSAKLYLVVRLFKGSVARSPTVGTEVDELLRISLCYIEPNRVPTIMVNSGFDSGAPGNCPSHGCEQSTSNGMYGGRADAVRDAARSASTGQPDLRQYPYRSEIVAPFRMRERWNPHRCGAEGCSRSIPESDGHRVPVFEKPTAHYGVL
jgi:hypothetical protein